jgi:propionyl-CoA synthetase
MEQNKTKFLGKNPMWVAGHGFIVYGPLINRNTTVLLKKTNTNQMREYVLRVIAEHKVSIMFTV